MKRNRKPRYDAASKKRRRALEQFRKFEAHLLFLERTGYPPHGSTNDYFGIFSKNVTPHPAKRQMMVKCILAIRRSGNEEILKSDYFIRALNRMCKFDLMIGNPSRWNGNGTDLDAKRTNFLEAMMVQYAIPDFSRNCWDYPNEKHWRWTAHIGNGKKLRDLPQADFPITQGMSKFLWQVPVHFDWDYALHWMWMRSHGVREQLATVLATMDLYPKRQDRERFREIVLVLNRFEYHEHAQYHLIVRYLQHRQQEQLGMPGREQSFRQLVLDSLQWWYRDKLPDEQNTLEWKACYPNLPSLKFQGGGFELVELKTAAEVIIEGVEMKHCVSSFIPACASGVTRIFSFRYDCGGKKYRIATLEVNVVDQSIEQALANNNQQMFPFARKLLNYWIKNHKVQFPGACDAYRMFQQLQTGDQ